MTFKDLTTGDRFTFNESDDKPCVKVGESYFKVLGDDSQPDEALTFLHVRRVIQSRGNHETWK